MWGLELWLVLTLAILVRVIAPNFGAAERDGYIAICSGSEMIYVPISQVGDAAMVDQSLKDAEHAVERAPCIWLGQFLAILPYLATLLPLAVRAQPLAEVRHHQVRHQGAVKPFQSQGPPLAAA